MVQLTQLLCKYYPKWLPKPTGGNSFLRKQALFRLTYAQPGRTRNCYRLASRRLVKQLREDQEEAGRMQKFHRDLCSQRILAACEDVRFPYKEFVGKLPRVSLAGDRPGCD